LIGDYSNLREKTSGKFHHRAIIVTIKVEHFVIDLNGKIIHHHEKYEFK